MSFRKSIFLLPLGLSLSVAEVLGPIFPAPTDLSGSDSHVKAAWDNLTSTLDSYLKDNQNSSSVADLIGAENVTWSTGLFSLHDAAAAQFQYHWTSPEIANAVNGTHEVDGDSIYRTASVSKLITSFVGQLELTQKQWHTPLSELIPGLGSGGSAEDPLSPTAWDDITPWALANQQAGVTTNGLPIIDNLGAAYTLTALLTNTSVFDLEAADGFPPELFSVLGPCTDLANTFCYADDFIASVKMLHPNLLPWTTPAYANFGFMMLGLAISNATGKSYDDLYARIFEPLEMSSTTLDAPDAGSEDFDRSVIVGPDLVSGGFDNPGSRITVPSGGVLSTTNDLAKLGTGILDNSLLSPLKTREWMKPHGHTSSLTYSIGAPWEIVRYIHPDSGKVTDIYTKLGDSGAYGGILALIPEYDAGFSFLNAATNAVRSPVALNVINRITETIVPALEAQARAEAQKNFVGEYRPAEGSLNSSLIVSFNESTIEGGVAPSLSISSWISNGTDMLINPPFLGVQPQLQLTIPKQTEGPGKVAFEGFKDPQWNTYLEAGLGPFSGFYASNFGWAQVDQDRYAGNNVGTFVFDVGADGKAECVRTAGTQATLSRVDS